MAFSGALTLTDLNDFITPSQACIKPVEEVKAPQDFPVQGAASTQIHIDSEGSYYEVATYNDNTAAPANPARKLEAAQISLNDCLACSGCITSAESVLITLQSHEEVLNVLASNAPAASPEHRVAVLSIAPQCLASLAASVSSSSRTPVTPREILHRVQAFARELGFDRVYDTTFARHIALLEHAREFRERQSAAAAAQPRSGGCQSAEASGVKAPCSGCGANGHENPTLDGEDDKPPVGRLPMLAGACPGWVCYAEKTHGEMLPFLSRTKSPQQVMGTLVKQWLAPKWGKKPNEVYHVTVMPCYDKKLEASRPDFYDAVHATRDVDCVITTGELDRMMRERGWDISRPVLHDSDSAALPPFGTQVADTPEPAFPSLLTHPGTSSGSYLHALLGSYTAADPSLQLTARTVRSADYEEYTLADARTGRAVFRGARCYGFRNLQNLVRRVGREAGVQVGRGAAGRLAGGGGAGAARGRGAGGAAAAVRARKLKAKAMKGAEGDSASVPVSGVDALQAEGAAEERGYDYVEVMACPGGCVNGGGQLRPPPSFTSPRPETEPGSQLLARGPIAAAVADGPRAAADGGEGMMVQNESAARWGDKAWVKRVEAAYWHDLPTPPASPPAPPSATLPSAPAPAPAAVCASSPTTPTPQTQTQTQPNTTVGGTPRDEADALALRVLSELCLRPPHSSSGRADVASGAPPAATTTTTTWAAPLPSARAEAARRRFFRTEYHAVAGEVSGIQVQW